MKKIAEMLLAAGCVFAGGMVLTQTTPVKAEEMTEDRIAEGVYIGNVSVGGMTTQEAQNAVEEYVNQILDTTFTLSGADGSIDVTASEMGMTADTQDAVDYALTVAHSGNLINRYKDICDLEENSVVLDMNLKIDRQATANILYDHSDSLNVEALDNGLTIEGGQFQFVEGQIGSEVDIVQSVYGIENYIATVWDGTDSTIQLVTTEVQPRGSQEELAQVRDLLGSFSTNFSSSTAGRAQNVKNGCAKLNGIVVYPGEELSVYATISPFTQENGYELAGAYSNGQVVESFGGGICQVATTLYNAIIRAELDVTMRYNHSMLVSYVDPSDDAAIAGTYKDLRFVNDMDTPVYIEGYCNNGIITFNIYGVETRPANRTISFESETVSKSDPTYQFNQDSSKAVGYWHVEQSAHLGTEARLWKIVKVDGVEQSRDLFNSSTYISSPKIITIGTMGATEEQLAALNAAIATGDEATVRSTVNSLSAAASESPEQSETTTEEPTTTTPSATTTPTTTVTPSTSEGTTETDRTTENQETTTSPGAGQTESDTDHTDSSKEEAEE